MQGVVTHSNAPLADSLVIMDPHWLLKQITLIVRRPSLHPLAIDKFLPRDPFDMLYTRGVLETGASTVWTYIHHT